MGILRTALYCRLSKDDMAQGDSESIKTQKAMLTQYAREHEFLVVETYVDDGWSGLNFDRPGFQNMIAECRTGKVRCVVVKDLSRLGRNYVEVGNLLEQLFPFLGVRVVSINGNYDSDNFSGQTGGIEVAFKNLVYNMYSRDLSQKVKSAVATRMKRGEYIGPFGLFGYEKSPEDIHKLLIDDEAAAIVRRIFLMVIDDMPRREIVKILNEEGIPTPVVYKQRKGCTRDWYPDGKKGDWNTSMVAKIIRDERYAGHMVSHKKVYESFESKHQVAVDESDWIIVRNTHEGIVTQEEFDKANANMQTVQRGKKDNPANKKNFSVIICPHCGLTLRPGNKKDIYMYCPTGRTHNDSPCKNVRIRKKVVENTLVRLVRNQAEMLVTAENILKQKKENRFGQDQPDDILLNKLKQDSKDYKNLEIGKYSLNEKKNIIRSLMNIRMPRTASDELLKLQDRYLQEELSKKGIVTLFDIPTIKEQYGIESPFAEKISLWQGDITRLKVGAIVNAANSQMLGCFVPCHSCIDNAIHSAAGIQLRDECSRIMNQRRIHYGKQYEEPTGTATLTLSYNLPCDYVIHTVGPIVYGVLNDEMRQELRNCYESVFKYCVENKIKSVAFCCISTGEFHFPNNEAAQIAVETVMNFLKTNHDMERIIFNVFKDSDRDIYQNMLRLLI